MFVVYIDHEAIVILGLPGTITSPSTALAVTPIRGKSASYRDGDLRLRYFNNRAR